MAQQFFRNFEARIQRKKINFFAHAVTLAQFLHPLKWIEILDLDLYDVYLASQPIFKNWVGGKNIQFIETSSLDPALFTEIVVQDKPIYDRLTFEKHIEEDLQILDRIKPDLVIGDFRHSLTVSSRLRKIKYFNITNAYWSTESKLTYPMPEAPIVHFLGETVYNLTIRPLVPLKIQSKNQVFVGPVY